MHSVLRGVYKVVHARTETDRSCVCLHYRASSSSLTSPSFYDSSALNTQFSSLKTQSVDLDAKDRKEDIPLATIRIFGLDREGSAYRTLCLPIFVEHTTALSVFPDAVDLALCQLLHGHGCSIAHAEQHRDRDANCFFQRIVFDYSTMHTDMVSLEYGVQEVCTRFRMEFQLNWGSRPKRLCIFVSKYDHVQCSVIHIVRFGSTRDSRLLSLTVVCRCCGTYYFATRPAN